MAEIFLDLTRLLGFLNKYGIVTFNRSSSGNEMFGRGNAADTLRSRLTGSVFDPRIHRLMRLPSEK